MAVDVRFHKWDEILKMPKPNADMKTTTVFWHFARGMALAAKGKPDEAQADYQVVAEAEKNTPEDVVFAMPVNNKTKDVLKIARDVLGAKIALAKKDNCRRDCPVAGSRSRSGLPQVQRARGLVLPGARISRARRFS